MNFHLRNFDKMYILIFFLLKGILLEVEGPIFAPLNRKPQFLPLDCEYRVRSASLMMRMYPLNSK